MSGCLGLNIDRLIPSLLGMCKYQIGCILGSLGRLVMEKVDPRQLGSEKNLHCLQQKKKESKEASVIYRSPSKSRLLG